MQAPELEQAMLAYRGLIRTSRKLRRLVRPIFDAWNLTGAQFATLSRIPPGGISLTELAATSLADPATVSGVVERLAKSGLVERARSETDRRVLVITLTPRGREIVDAITPLHQRAMAQVLGKVSPERLALLCELLSEVERLIDEAKETLGTMPKPSPRDRTAAAFETE